MNVLATASPGAGFTLGDDQFDDVACLPARVSGFDLRPYREARVHARRRRSRFGFIAAVCGGFVGALALQSWAQHERRLEHQRASEIASQVDALAPALSEMGQWQTLIDADSAQRAWLEALAPRRTWLLRLLDLLAAATRTGVRIVDMQVRPASAAASSDSSGSADAQNQTASSELRLHIAGLAEDADTLAQWAADLAAQPGVISVDLDGVHRLEDRRREPPSEASSREPMREQLKEPIKEPLGERITEPIRGPAKGPTRNPEGEYGISGTHATPRLNAFRLTLVWRDPAVAVKAKVATRPGSTRVPATQQ